MTTLTKTHLLLQEKLAYLQAAQRQQREDNQEPTIPQVTKGQEITPPVGKSPVKRIKKSNQSEAGTKSKGPRQNKPIYSINSMEMAMAEELDKNQSICTLQNLQKS